jgi:hypothetical protein
MPGAVAFVLTNRNLFYGLTVANCSGRPMWTISNEKLVEPPTRITYGVAPTGFVSRTGPLTLTPGCYEVIVSGPSRARFHIGADGRLVPEPGARQADSVPPPRMDTGAATGPPARAPSPVSCA